eukprot:UN22982
MSSRTMESDLPNMSMFFEFIFKENHLEYVSCYFGVYFIDFDPFL